MTLAITVLQTEQPHCSHHRRMNTAIGVMVVALYEAELNCTVGAELC